MTRATPADLVRPQGTILILLDEVNLGKEGHIFVIHTPDYHFSAGVFGRQLQMRRNECEVHLPITRAFRHPKLISIWLEWAPHLLQVSYAVIPALSGDVDAKRALTTPSCRPPPSLIRWLRKQNLLETIVYDSESAFRDRVHSILGTLQDTTDALQSEDGFWDLLYDGNRIVSRSPKRETDLHSLLHGLLLDQFLMSSIEVIPEYSMGVGRLDFMLMGSVKNREPVKLCLELKHAHSPDLIRGLTVQLPRYMQGAGAKNGVYVVLWYGHSAGTANESCADLQSRLVAEQLLCFDDALSKRIRVFTLDLTASVKASQRQTD
jgi:hypothetical protein